MGGGGEDKTYHPLASTLPPTNPFRLQQGEGDALWKMGKEGKSKDGKKAKKVLIARWSLYFYIETCFAAMLAINIKNFDSTNSTAGP